MMVVVGGWEWLGVDVVSMIVDSFSVEIFVLVSVVCVVWMVRLFVVFLGVV